LGVDDFGGHFGGFAAGALGLLELASAIATEAMALKSCSAIAAHFARNNCWFRRR
jgi:hypothetical protein